MAGRNSVTFADHPKSSSRSRLALGKRSSAAGRYQFLGSTWDAQRAKLGLADFSPQIKTTRFGTSLEPSTANAPDATSTTMPRAGGQISRAGKPMDEPWRWIESDRLQIRKPQEFYTK